MNKKFSELHDMLWTDYDPERIQRPKNGGNQNKSREDQRGSDILNESAKNTKNFGITKRCPKCGENKQLTDFYKSRRSGTSSYCKKCKSIYQKLNQSQYYRKRHPIRSVIKKCKICGKEFKIVNDKRGTSFERKKYCSDKCRYQYVRREKYERICIVCGKKFMTKSISAKCCSKECIKLKILGHPIIRHCPKCGKEHLAYPRCITFKRNKLCKVCENKRNRRLITDSYIKSDLKKRREPITKMVIELTRQRIIMKRTLKQLRERIKNESDCYDVQRKQFTVEKNYERKFQD